ncbi:MAG TPA: chromate efflux transporter [Dongiaceae bacterium]|nr:chromate efflux transporter [Dongiaceae bacterium]
MSFAEAVRVWARIGLLGFGGPAGQIALMHRILVDEKRWIDEGRFLHALNYCMLLPGPEAQQLATYVGWLLHRTAGGLAAGILFVLPGFVAMLALSVLYAGFQEVEPVQAVFFGIKPAVLAIVVHAVVRIGRRALRDRALIGLAAAAFIGIFFFDLPFPLIVLGAAAIGFLGSRLDPRAFAVVASHGAAAEAGRVPDPARPSLLRAAGVLVLWSGLWLSPLALLALTVGPADVFTQIATFFSKMAVVTFGGAYAVLAYVAQEAVGHYGWLRPGEMLDGLGLAETTPGPLIMVVQFVGFLAAYRDPGPFDPMLAGLLGATLTVWVTFTPCFLWIFLGAPYVEALRGNRPLNAALGAITAAVVGVILNLAVWFALHTVFGRVDEIRGFGLRLWAPDPASLDVAALLLALGALVAMFRFRVGMLPTLAGSAAAGAALYFLA